MGLRADLWPARFAREFLARLACTSGPAECFVGRITWPQGFPERGRDQAPIWQLITANPRGHPTAALMRQFAQFCASIRHVRHGAAAVTHDIKVRRATVAIKTTVGDDKPGVLRATIPGIESNTAVALAAVRATILEFGQISVWRPNIARQIHGWAIQYAGINQFGDSDALFDPRELKAGNHSDNREHGKKGSSHRIHPLGSVEILMVLSQPFRCCTALTFEPM
jgi:hypothetical protein